jgi:VanZ family protein
MKLVPPDYFLRGSRALFLLGLVAVTVLSLLPAPYLPSLRLNVWDKAQHTVAYAGLALAGLTGRVGRGVVLVIGLLAHGAAMEFAQALLGWRSGDLLDWGADAVGVIVAYVLVWGIRSRVV